MYSSKFGNKQIHAIFTQNHNRVLCLGKGENFKVPEFEALLAERIKGSCVIVGRKTFERIKELLDGSVIIVLSNNPDFKFRNCLTSSSVEDALKLAATLSFSKECIFLLGGGQIFTQLYSYIDSATVCNIYNDDDGDSFFPELSIEEWEVKPGGRNKEHYRKLDGDTESLLMEIVKLHPKDYKAIN